MHKSDPDLKVELLGGDTSETKVAPVLGNKLQFYAPLSAIKPKIKGTGIQNSPFILLLVAVLVLMGTAIFLWWYLSRHESPVVTLSLPLPTQKPRAVIPEALVAFTVYHEASSSSLVLYDITQKREITLDSPLSTERDGLVNLGPWSPDGRYLPILIIRDSSLPNPIYLYDSMDGQARKIIDTRSVPDLLSSVTSFNYLSRWLQNDILVFNLRASPEENTDELVLISSTGHVSRVSRPSKLIRGNRRLEISSPLATDSATQLVATRHMKLDGNEITFDFKGEVVGVLNETLVTLESPEQPDLLQLNENRSFTASLKQAATEIEAEQLLEQALRPTGDWQLHFYQITDGGLTHSRSLADDSWLTIGAQIRPKRDTILIHQQDKQLPPFNSRYIEIDPKKVDERRLIAEGTGETDDERTYGNSFYLSADGGWLIGYAPSENPPVYPLGKTIVAWQIDSGEKLILCEDACDQVRVFNPETLRLK